jgi:hypothetical protein
VPRGDKSGATWQRIGMVELDRDAVSTGCDAKLHFAPPTETLASRAWWRLASVETFHLVDIVWKSYGR